MTPDDALFVDATPREVHPGVHVERRGFLSLAGVGVAGLGLPAMGSAGVVERARRALAPDDDARPGDEPLAFDGFLDRTLALAEAELTKEVPHQDSYLLRVAAAMTRLAHVPEAEGEPFGDLAGLEVARLHRQNPISVMELRLEPHAVIPLHNHNGYAGNLLGLQGELRIKSFDPAQELSEPTPREPFLLRQTGDLWMTPGRTATLTTRRDNFHLLQAGPEGGRALDLFTFFRAPGRSGFFDLAASARDEAGRIFEATPRG